MRDISFVVGSQQPARGFSCIRSSPIRVCEAAETKTCCSNLAFCWHNLSFVYPSLLSLLCFVRRMYQ